QVVVLDIHYDLAEPDPYPALLAGLGPDALAEIEPGSRLVVLPAPADLAAVTAVSAMLPGSRISVGCTLALPQAGQSLRWARLASRLRVAGLLPDEPVLVCDEHVPLLLLEGEPGLADVLVRRRLEPLLALPEARRLKFARLLSAWLEHGGSQAELAQQLGAHRQTLHYRIGRLQEMFGAQLRDAQARVEILLALRAALPRWEASGEAKWAAGPQAEWEADSP
ncbi:MAG TPA: helix-turn-helix domain-containing protein, partial [Jatrophihabitans sp.]|nr:helix-turn-helix domain-containing protein [Jatrophihabitans sp.]